MDDADLDRLARQLGRRLAAAGETVATAESCTGGWIAKCITDVAGSSAWFQRGLVTYSDAAKTALAAVPQGLIERHGAVSEAVVCAMAEGALRQAGANIAVAVSGVAGPGGGSADKPVGLVWFAWARRTVDGAGTVSRQHRFDGDRGAVRRQSVAVALLGLIDTALPAESKECNP